MTSFIVHHRDRPHIALFVAGSLGEAVAALTAQPNTDGLAVYAHDDNGFSRELTVAERAELGDLTV